MGLKDDLIYGFLLVISIPIGHFLNKCRNGRNKQYISALVGLLMISFVCRLDLIHSLTVATVNAALVSFLNRRVCHVASFIWCFGYISFFRTTHYFGFPKVLPHSNAVQLLLTLKMVGLAFEVHDTAKQKKAAESPDADENAKLQYEYQRVEPSFLDIILYSYCYIGLLTGPYYKYRTYIDMINQKQTEYIDTYRPLMNRIRKVPVYATLYLITSQIFTVEYVREDTFFENVFVYRLLYMTAMFFVFRMRLYCAWILAEALCVSAGLGAYPANSRPKCGRGPTDFTKLKQTESMAPNGVAYDFETIHNVDEYGCEFAPTVRGGMRSWNMTVQFWLASHVYRRVSFKSNGARVAVTMLVSAYWHGIHPGYYLSFLTIPINLIAEDLCISAFRKDASPRQQKTFDWVCWFLKMRTFEYMSMGFLLLTYFDTMRYWRSIYFIPHIVIFFFIAIGLAFKPKRGHKGVKTGLDSETKKDVLSQQEALNSDNAGHVKTE